MKINRMITGNYTFLEVTSVEALEIIRSLSQQLVNKDPNTDRPETVTKSGERFSIGINFNEV